MNFLSLLMAGFFFANVLFAEAPPKKVQSPAPAKDTKAQPVVKKQPQPSNIKKPVAFDLSKTIEDVQKKYNQTTSARFNFSQTYQHPFLPVNETSQGEVLFKKQKMVWLYQKPADKVKSFYINEKRFTYFQPRDKIAFTHDCFDKDTLSASIAFLWGQGKIKESFNTTKMSNPLSDTLRWITLIPKEKTNPQVQYIHLGIALDQPLVKESIVIDATNGRNHFVFSNIQTNIPISDQSFVFTPPPGENINILPMPNVTCPTPPPVPKEKPKAPPAKAAPKKSTIK